MVRKVDASEGVGAEVFVADRVLVILLVVVRIAWVVLLLRLMMFVASLLVKHLIKEATELGIDQCQKRQNSKKVPHFVDDSTEQC